MEEPTTLRAGKLLICIALLAAAFPAVAGDLSAVESAVVAVKPALVRIHVVSIEDENGRETKEESFGSGAIISPDGYVVTNHHVAGHAKQIFCTMSDKTEVDAELVGTDASTDICVIRLTPQTPTKYTPAKFGDSSKLKVGDRVLAMGSPLALSQSVTAGIVSNTELVMPDMWGGLTLDGEDVGSLVRWIGHDARIQPGNSGGPLVNEKGEIVGINEIEFGLGGAIPANIAAEVTKQLMTGGKVRRAWTGFAAQPLLKSSGMTKGVLIRSVLKGSPAEKAGITDGDILLSLSGHECNVRFDEEMPIFNQFVADLTIGKEVDAVVKRGGKEIAVKLTPMEKADVFAKPVELKNWGMCASDVTFFAAKEMNRDSTAGVRVTSVREGGPAADAKPALDSDDVIVRVGEKAVSCVKDLVDVTDGIVARQSEPVPTIVVFERDAEQYLTVVKIGLEEIDDPGLEARKAWLPVSQQVLTRDMANALGCPDKTGVRVTRIYSGSTAEKAGLAVGDIITAVDNDPVQASEPEDVEVFPVMVRQYKVGSSVNLTVLRGGKNVTMPVTLEMSPKLAREMKKYRNEDFEMTVRDLCFFDRAQNMWPDTLAGALVETADQGGWASLGGLESGDLITAVDGKPVTDVESFEAEMKRIAAAKPKNVVMQVTDGQQNVYVEMTPVWSAD